MRRFLFPLWLVVLSVAAFAPQVQASSAVDTLKIINLKTGTGAPATDGARVTVNYRGWLYDPNARGHQGRQFDSSFDHGKPFSFTLGAGQVIQGWDKGIKGMRVGGKRRLIIPPSLAYGSRGAGNVIPPDATLVFTVTLLKVHKP